MKFLVLGFFALLVPVSAGFAQHTPSEGQKLVQAAFTYQQKLLDSTATIAEAIEKWRKTAAHPAVQKEQDLLAIAYGSEGLLEVQRGDKTRGDSLLRKAMPLFRYKHSKASYLVAFA